MMPVWRCAASCFCQRTRYPMRLRAHLPVRGLQYVSPPTRTPPCPRRHCHSKHAQMLCIDIGLGCDPHCDAVHVGQASLAQRRHLWWRWLLARGSCGLHLGPRPVWCRDGPATGPAGRPSSQCGAVMVRPLAGCCDDAAPAAPDRIRCHCGTALCNNLQLALSLLAVMAGGITSDFMFAKIGFSGRLWAQFPSLSFEGLMLFAFDSCASLAWHTAGALRSRECASLLDEFWRRVGGSFVHHLERYSFIIIRTMIGCAGATFMTNQFWCSLMFAPNIAGTANANHQPLVGATSVEELAPSILVRVSLGTLLERFGPMNVQACLMSFGAVWVALSFTIWSATASLAFEH